MEQNRKPRDESMHLWTGFPGGSDGKASAYHVGELGSIPGLGRSPGKENGILSTITIIYTVQILAFSYPIGQVFLQMVFPHQDSSKNAFVRKS